MQSESLFPTADTRRVYRLCAVRTANDFHLCHVSLVSSKGVRLLSGYAYASGQSVELILGQEPGVECTVHAVRGPHYDLAFRDSNSSAKFELLLKRTR